MIDKQDLKTIVMSFNINNVKKILEKYTTEEINESLQEIEITPYKHAPKEKIKLLIEHGVDVNLPLNNGLTPAFFETELENFKILFDNGLSLTETDYMGLNLFAYQSIEDILKFVIKNSDIKPDFNNEMGIYYLPNTLGLLKLYFEYDLIKADQIFKDGQNLSFYLDLFGNDIETIKYLIDKKVDFNKEDDKGNKGLYVINNIEGFEYVCNHLGVDFKNKNIEEIKEIHWNILPALLKDRINELNIDEVIRYFYNDKEEIIKYLKNNPKQASLKVDEYRKIYSKKFINDYQNKEQKLLTSIKKLYLNDSEGIEFLNKLENELNIPFDKGIVSNFAFDINKRIYPLAMDLWNTEEELFKSEYPNIDICSNNKENIYLIRLLKDCCFISDEEEKSILNEMDNVHVAIYGMTQKEIDEEEDFNNPKPKKIKLTDGKIEPDEAVIREKVLLYLKENQDMRWIISIDLDSSFFWGYFDFSNENLEYLNDFEWMAEGSDPICFYKDETKQMYVGYSEDNYFYNIASYFQDVPLYYIYHRKSYELNSFPFYEEVFKAFNKYKAWCDENGIVLDKNNIYLDENKNIFNKPTAFE